MAEAVGLAASIGGLVTIALQVSKAGYEYISSVKNARDDIKQLVDEISLLTSILNPLQKEEEASKLGNTSGSDPVAPLLAECERFLVNLNAQLQPVPKGPSQGLIKRPWSLKKSLKWPFKEKETRKGLDKIHRLTELVNLKLRIDEELRTEIDSILRWISDIRPDQRHANIQANRKPDIGNWLLETPEFVKWKTENSSSVLLGRGVAGAGKTYLSSVVIDHLNEERISKRYGVAHVYFQYQEQKQQTSLPVLASIVKQLLSQIPQNRFPETVRTTYQAKKSRHPEVGDLTEILKSMPKMFSRVFVICDALDEMDQHTQRDYLLPLFHHMKDFGIALFLTTRPHPADVQLSFQNASIIIELTPEENDVRRYVEDFLSNNAVFQNVVRRCANDLHGRAVTAIVDSTLGIFLLAKFNAEFVCGLRNPGGVELAIQNISRSASADTNAGRDSERDNERRMDEIYDRIISSIHEHSQRRYGFRALSWIAYATRTLTAEELLAAISMDKDQDEIKESDIIELQDLLDISNGLIIADDNGDNVRLVHFSARNYFDRHRDVLPEYTKESYRTMTCLKSISFKIIKDGHSSQKQPGDNRQSSPFLDYAANNLGFHQSRMENRSDSDIINAILRLLEDEQHRRTYCEANWRIKYANDLPPLNVACEIGYEGAVKHLLKGSDIDINRKDDIYERAPLSWSVAREHIAVVNLLLQRDGIETSPEDWSGTTPLYMAVCNGNTEIVRILLSKGVKVDLKGSVSEQNRERNYRR